MRMLKGIVLATALVCGYAPARASGFGVEGYGARADHRWGGEIGLGYRFSLGQFHLTPAAGALIYPNDSDRYERESISGGRTICRDTSNGRFAKKSKCGASVRAYGRVEATFSIPLVAEIGGGVRVSDKLRPYGTVAVPLAPAIRLKANGGPGYYAFGATAGF